jgi:hypothetical protein
LDEQNLYEDCQRARQQISEIEREWSESSSPDGGDGWESTVSELDRRLDDLRQRIDHSLP